MIYEYILFGTSKDINIVWYVSGRNNWFYISEFAKKKEKKR